MRRRVRLDAVGAAPPLAEMAPQPKRRMKEALRKLAEDPSGREGRLDVKALHLEDEAPHLYRLRVGDWRAVFTVRDGDIIVVRIFHREEGYGWLERLK